MKRTLKLHQLAIPWVIMGNVERGHSNKKRLAKAGKGWQTMGNRAYTSWGCDLA